MYFHGVLCVCVCVCVCVECSIDFFSISDPLEKYI